MCGARGSAHLVTWWTRTARQPSRADTAPHGARVTFLVCDCVLSPFIRPPEVAPQLTG